MKKLFYIILAATAIVACSKEAELINNYEPVVNENGQVTYTFKAYIEDITKASISESNGKFSWGEAGDDQIAVWDAAHSKFVTFTSTDNAGNFSCETDAGANFNGQDAYYPASIAKTDGTKGYDFPTSFTSLAAAAKGFPMSGTVTADGKITFAHLGCLIKLTLNNVPDFTTALILNDETRNITVPITTTGVIEAVIPIPEGSYVLTANLKDDNNNIFYSHARSSKTYTKKNFYPTNAINLGTVVKFSGTGTSAISKVRYVQKIVEADGGNNFTWNLLTLLSGTKYAILPFGSPSSWEWLEEGFDTVRIEALDGDGNIKASTGNVYVRDFDFTITSGDDLLKTSFRIYPYGTTDATYLYATYWNGEYDTPTNITFTVTEASAWSEFDKENWYWYSPGHSSDWPGNSFSKNGSFTIPSADIVGSEIKIVINNGTGGGTNQTNDLDISVSSSTSSIAISLDGYDEGSKKRMISSVSATAPKILSYPLGTYPGAAIAIPGSFDSSKYVTIPVSYAGKTLDLKFNDNDDYNRDWNNLLINRDYYYGF